MKRMNKMLLVAALAATTLSAQAEQKKGPAWLSDALFYQIYPSSYMDTDGNGIGDLPGITSKLDYIKSLGVNALWLNPIFESGWFDGGYDVIDFYKVDPRFGTNTDLVTLVNEAHKRGMKVCLDLVAGHSSTKCAWFKESSEKDPNQRYSDYYIWMNDIPESEKKEIEARHQEASPESSTRGRYVEANAPRAKYYEKNFFECQPALNYGFAHPDPNHPWEQSVDAPDHRLFAGRYVTSWLSGLIRVWMDSVLIWRHRSSRTTPTRRRFPNSGMRCVHGRTSTILRPS